MNEQDVISIFQKEIRQASVDIKAEVQILLAREKGLWEEHYLTSSIYRFRREYSRDIVDSQIREDANKQSHLEINLSRTGIYDQLPEGLFFRDNTRRRATVADLALDYKTNKKKEADIRKFFQPFDHDIFLQRLTIEEEENLLLEGLQSGILNDYFIRFWNLPASIPRQLLSPLILLLPYASKIAGDLDLTARSLQQILKEDVHISKRHLVTQDATFPSPAMGEGTLGFDMVCGDCFWEHTSVFEIRIGPLRASTISEYLEDGKRFNLLETFTRFFVPAGVETVVDIVVTREKSEMTLKPGAEPILGFSSYL
jgi:hypothetical protein